MTNGKKQEVTPEQRQAWLTEYQVCEQDNNASASNYWTTFGIFAGFNTAFVGAVTFIIGSGNNQGVIFLVLIVGASVFGFVEILNKWLERVAHLIRMNHRRMREIEISLGMSKNTDIFWLDEWNKEGVNKKTIPSRLRRFYPPPRTGAKQIPRLLWVFKAPWIILFIYALITQLL